MRLKTIAVVLGLFSLISLAQAEEWTKTYTTSGQANLRVESNDAGVEIRGADGNQIEAVVTTRGYKFGPNDIRITEHQTGDSVELDVIRPHRVCFGICNQNIEITVRVPHSCNLRVHTGDGHIKVDDVKGEMQLDSGDGSLTVNSGDGSLNADTRDGRIRALGRFDRLDLHTRDGSIEAEATAGSRMKATWSVRTGDGHIQLRLPADFAADLDAHTGDGHVSVDFPVTVAGDLRQSTIHGKMNGGGQMLEVRTGDGDIRVEKF
ncbi:MAG TPA: DUF4097 family beta strand repeat-containing protein [Terriglobales bacterium]|nr:DUF4097 family beta strand repeat-containing protein [Terriglobales bacterium]